MTYRVLHFVECADVWQCGKESIRIFFFIVDAERDALSAAVGGDVTVVVQQIVKWNDSHRKFVLGCFVDGNQNKCFNLNGYFRVGGGADLDKNYEFRRYGTRSL